MFVCALEPKALRALFEDRFVLDDLKSLGAGVALVARDFSEERAQAVRLLNKLEIPVSAWLLLPGEQGSWLDPTHTAQAAEIYQALKKWSGQKGLRWSAVGFGALADQGKALEKRGSTRTPDMAKVNLIAQARADGFAVELVYAGSEAHANQKLQIHSRRRMTESVPGADRLIRLQPFTGAQQERFGASPAGGVGEVCVSSTNGSLNLSAPLAGEPKSWQEFAREVCTARQKSGAMYIFTLESCAKQGFLDRLVTLDWNGQAPGGSARARRRAVAPDLVLSRKGWLGFAALAGVVGSALLIVGKKRRKS